MCVCHCGTEGWSEVAEATDRVVVLGLILWPGFMGQVHLGSLPYHPHPIPLACRETVGWWRVF